MRKARWAACLAGLLGCDALGAEPKAPTEGPRIANLLLQASARKKQVALDIELAGIKQAGVVQLVARMLDEKGNEEKRFTAEAKASDKETQSVRAAWPWDKPRLWDLGQPNLYTLKLEAKGAGLEAEAAVRFAFIAEPLLRECCAAYLGSRAYTTEHDARFALTPAARRPGSIAGLLLEFPASATAFRLLSFNQQSEITNQKSIAWLCGPPDSIEAKDHSFLVGAKLAKQLAIHNPTRETLPYTFSWNVVLGGAIDLRSVSGTGKIEPGKTLFEPIEVDLPASVPADKFPGEIRLSASVGAERCEETFPFRVFRKPPPGGRVVAVVDPVGDTTALLKLLGFMTEPWGGTGQAPLVVVGRNALVRDPRALKRLEEHVRQGGRAVVFAQDPDWLEKQAGFRVAKEPARRVFPVDPRHPMLLGVDDDDLRDWAGGRGVVCGAPIEKPHLSSWRPVLECGFDLAYSPLMELDYGKGRLVLCTLDLEGHAAHDPVALWMGRKAMVYATAAPLQPKADKPVVAGDDAAESTLKALGAIYDRPTGAHSMPDLMVFGHLSSVNRTPIEDRINNGGLKAAFLARRQPEGALGVGLELVKGFGGSLEAPAWPECRGLSASDLRWRVEADAWLVKSGAEVGAKGLLGRRAIGKGVALLCQIDPLAPDADKNPSLRPT
ncbi:MAG: hypothetical protein FJ291_30880, partial [Planctomycetes bacterium]|nr:hypothetical protein [Planctomycetota bacterium]